jgi:diketogulonate reductase-like aldo/keto reductase
VAAPRAPFPATGPRNRRRNNDIGVNNYSAELIEALVDGTGETPTVNQIEWSPIDPRRAHSSRARHRGSIEANSSVWHRTRP